MLFLNWLSMKMTLNVWKVVVRGIRRIGYGKLCPGIIILEGFFIRNSHFVGLQPVPGSLGQWRPSKTRAYYERDQRRAGSEEKRARLPRFLYQTSLVARALFRWSPLTESLEQPSWTVGKRFDFYPQSKKTPFFFFLSQNVFITWKITQDMLLSGSKRSKKFTVLTLEIQHNSKQLCLVFIEVFQWLLTFSVLVFHLFDICNLLKSLLRNAP